MNFQVFTKIVVTGAFILTAQLLQSQNLYREIEGESIFSFAELEQNGEKIDNIVRYTSWFHLQILWHIDFSDNFGMFSGIANRNIGYISEPSDTLKYKRRSYALGIPLALKTGSFDKNFYFFAGGEMEMMYNYKQKTFINDKKEDKFNEWFSDRTNMFIPSVFAGVQFPGGWEIKFKYYLMDFMNPDFEEEINNAIVKPYDGLTSRIWYISLTYSKENDDE